MLRGASLLEGLHRARLPSVSAHCQTVRAQLEHVLRRSTLLCRRPWPVDLPPRATANLWGVFNACERIIISDIFIVRDWEHGQSLTIIRRIFLNDVVDV